MSNDFLTSFSGALQASLSVLLVILYGVIAAQFKILDGSAASQISTLCVRLFLPAILLSNVGAELHAATGLRYVPIIVWSLFYTLTSICIGVTLTRIFKLPAWITPAITFNNTTGMPLLLIESLAATGTLDSLLTLPNDTTEAATQRAKSYFLANAMICDSITFAFGPRLLVSPPSTRDERPKSSDGSEADANGNAHTAEDQRNEQEATEETSLLPTTVVQAEYRVARKVRSSIPQSVRKAASRVAFVPPPPMVGAVAGATIGLISPLHRAFFGDPMDGGIFTAWLMDSIKKIGNLFPALQTLVVGVRFSDSIVKMRRGEESGEVRWPYALLIICIRFLLWPLISVPVIYLFSSRTNLLSSDSILWFAMMLMPAGPSAMKILALADVSGSSEFEKMSIAKFLCLTYALVPLICFTVVAALKACHLTMKAPS